ncbi:phosphotransferase enzyme family protein [Marichromatium sp. AB32]|uniref:phosphotransferase enzyme family protein n=1 Tax=Marichromatium sp. AB32 TaxID=2483363 RepID=UPI001680CB68|nr:aminoglycoside phosphotransferase family protein [Marichromatium sp. AB32]
MPTEPVRLHALLAGFALAGDPDRAAITPLGGGLINDSFAVRLDERRYVLQRINARVFPDPARVIANQAALAAVWDAPGLDIPAPLPTRDGGFALHDDSGACWRLTRFIAPSRSLARLDHPAQARAVGEALGRFHRTLARHAPLPLQTALPGFHDTPAYLAGLRRLDTPTARRDPTLAESLDFVAQRAPLAATLATARAEGRIGEHVVHGDPKLDNLLFSTDATRVVALIDLDTVQPGLIHHDLGDCLRSCCNRAGEGGASARFDLALAAAILGGYAAATDGLLDAEERALIPQALRLVPFELGIRFLTDHLQGDRYFRVRRHGDNLRKARVQFALVADLERQTDEIETLVEHCFAEATSVA